MMRLIEKLMKMNQETFEPELVITVALPLQLKDIPNVLKTYEQWGKEFLDLIGAKVEE